MNPSKSQRKRNQKGRCTAHGNHEMRHPTVFSPWINKFLKRNILHGLFGGKPKMRKHFSRYQIRYPSLEINPSGRSMQPNRVAIHDTEEGKNGSE